MYLFSEKLISDMKKDNYKIQELTGMSKEKLDYVINKASSEEVSSLLYSLRFDVMQESMASKEEDTTDFIEVYNTAMSIIDVQHSYNTALRFLISKNLVNCSTDLSVFDRFENLEDIVYDFKDKDFLVRVSKVRYKAILGVKELKVFWVSFCFMEDTKVKVLEFELVPSKYPRLYTTEHICDNCKKCNIIEKEYKEQGDAFKNSCNLFQKHHRDGITCHMDCEIRKVSGYSIDDLLSMCAYSLDLYINRTKRKTDKSPENGIGVVSKRKISEVRGISEEIQVLSLKSYVSLERKEKREWQGGHHKAPIEHSRRGHNRILKSGKVVEVHGSTVNKGKGGKSVYKVN